MGVQLGLTR